MELIAHDVAGDRAIGGEEDFADVHEEDMLVIGVEKIVLASALVTATPYAPDS